MKKKSLPKIKKEIKHFLSQEEGGINKSNAAKIGMSLLILGVAMTGIMKSDPSLGACSHASHGSHASHSAHGAHGSHGSHSNHSRGGWC